MDKISKIINMNVIKIIVLFVIDYFKKIIESLIWLIRYVIQGSFHNYIKKEKSGKIIIIGNGPSVRGKMSEIINSKDCAFCCVNHAAKTDFFYMLKPQYYVLADYLFFCNNRNSKEMLTIDNLRKVDWNMTLFVPYRGLKQTKKEFESSKYVTVVPYNSIPYKGFACVKYFLYNIGFSMPLCNNVMVAALYVGVQLGFEKIDVYGLDFTWIKEMRVNEQNVVCRIDEHFYEGEVKITPWLKSDGTPFTVSSICRTLADGLDSFSDISAYSRRRGCKIYNMNKDSFIDCFEKI